MTVVRVGRIGAPVPGVGERAWPDNSVFLEIELAGVRLDLACDFSAEAPNQLWLSDITEHPTAEGKLYLCAVKDVFSTGSWGTASTRG